MINKRIEDYFKKSGLTKVQLAEQCNVSRTTLDNILSGGDAKVSTIQAIAKALNVSPSRFFEEETPGQAEMLKQMEHELSQLIFKRDRLQEDRLLAYQENNDFHVIEEEINLQRKNLKALKERIKDIRYLNAPSQEQLELVKKLENDAEIMEKEIRSSEENLKSQIFSAKQLVIHKKMELSRTLEQIKILETNIKLLNKSEELIDSSIPFTEEAKNDSGKPSKEVIQTKPRIPMNALAGTLNGFADSCILADCEQMPVIRSLPAYDYTIIVKGDSMTPNFESGDEIAIKKVSSFIEWGEVYVMDTRDGVVLKRIYDEGDCFKCVSFNSEYHDFMVRKEDVFGVYKVVGMIRF